MVRNVDLLKTIRYLIKLYLKRQKLARHALTELRPDLVLFSKGLDDSGTRNTFFELAKKHADVPYKGDWTYQGDTWRYFVHGAGIQLINQVTEEPIEWDSPYVDVFDKEWFLNWIHWYTIYHSDSKSAHELSNHDRHINTVIDTGISELEKLGGLTRFEDHPMRFQVLDI